MEKIILKSTIKNVFRVYQNQLYIGKILFYKNKYHLTNIYLKLKFKFFDCNISKEIFSKLRNKIVSPMQIIIPSDNQKLIDFLKVGGFACKRKCHIVQANIDNFVGCKNESISLSFCKKGDLLYEELTQIMFEYYCKTHSEINPWTSSFSAFYKLISKTIVYWNDNGLVQDFAFVEKNEIAYIYGVEKCKLKTFVENLVLHMFNKYQTINFECDDCDWCSQVLKDLFCRTKQTGYDTYICD